MGFHKLAARPFIRVRANDDSTVKAFSLVGINTMEMRDVEAPRIESPGDVIVRMAAMGVCGSDIHYYTDGRIGSQVVEYPWTVGHEGAGTVSGVGDGVGRVHPGERVAIDPAMPCYECDQCLAGRRNTCRNLKFLGCPGQVEGCLSELYRLPETSCHAIPDSMNFEQAALIEPLTIALHAVNLAGELSGKIVAVLGAGPIGLCTMLAAKADGAKRVYMTDRINERRVFAIDLGATFSTNADSQNLVETFDVMEPSQFDVVFECCGRQDALDQALRILKPGGQLMVVGIPTTDRISLDINLLRRKELSVQNVRRQNGLVGEAIDLIATGRIDVGPLITHRYPFNRADEAFDLVAGYRDGVIKAMIEF
jgi:L-iditol 2-dehydrogenase